MRDSPEHARAAGVKLIEAKRRIPHGQFMKWVATECGLHQSTANLYMKVAREWRTIELTRRESQRVRL